MKTMKRKMKKNGRLEEGGRERGHSKKECIRSEAFLLGTVMATNRNRGYKTPPLEQRPFRQLTD